MLLITNIETSNYRDYFKFKKKMFTEERSVLDRIVFSTAVMQNF